MKSLVFFAVFCLSTSQTLYTFYGERSPSGLIDWNTDLNCRTHEFTYRKGDYFVLWIKSYKIINSSTTVPIRADAVVRKQSGIWYRQHISLAKLPTKMQFYLDQDTITIDVQVTTDKACEEVRVLEGTEVSTLPKGANVTASKYNDICIRGRECGIAVEATKRCTDKKFSSQKCADDRDLPGHEKAEEDLDVMNTLTAARNFLDFLTPTNTSTTSTDNSKDGADNTYFTIMIVTSVTSAVAVILLLILAIRQRCWVRSNPPGMIHISPISDNRYYENVVFRTETDPGVDDQEQRIYDEPSATEMQYEEINNYTGRTQLN